MAPGHPTPAYLPIPADPINCSYHIGSKRQLLVSETRTAVVTAASRDTRHNGVLSDARVTRFIGGFRLFIFVCA